MQTQEWLLGGQDLYQARSRYDPEKILQEAQTSARFSSLSQPAASKTLPLRRAGGSRRHTECVHLSVVSGDRQSGIYGAAVGRQQLV